MNARRTALLLGLLLATSCNHGGQTGEESGGECRAQLSALRLDEQSPLGFTANDTLTLAQGEHSAAFEWLPAMAFPYGPESGASAVRVTVTSSGAPRYGLEAAPLREKAHVATDDVTMFCRDHLELPVVVTLSTSGGAFAERFSATLTASEPARASLSRSLPAETLSGGFALNDGEPFERVEVTLSFAEQAFSGSLQALIERTFGDSVSATIQPLACWGPTSADIWWCSPE